MKGVGGRGRRARGGRGGDASFPLSGGGGGKSATDSSATVTNPTLAGSISLTAGSNAPPLSPGEASTTLATTTSCFDGAPAEAVALYQPPRAYETLLSESSPPEFGASSQLRSHLCGVRSGAVVRPRTNAGCRRKNGRNNDRQGVRQKLGTREKVGEGYRQRAKRRPRTAGAGSGGVHGVLERMEGYDKVRDICFRHFLR